MVEVPTGTYRNCTYAGTLVPTWPHLLFMIARRESFVNFNLSYVTLYLILITHLYQSNNIIVIKTIAVEFPGQSQVIAAKLQAHHKS